ncbi:hypothetical protein GIS00_01350 [Nakamurella sp. YIM 132087]|uniref:Transmembrane protein n=1 Tax=Nakamurella alba TaxID=2665158 RepID=A0A7K1FET2_9ACTN|nr:gephyrin-like molybdotransferase receptor GlpR [Nakamurella alba]MTD12590.1 hypothetical protein [Nakamurella alba]
MSIPTSVAVGLLVIAWLAVLVPMVSRRREAVPEAEDEGTGGFRVLRRGESRQRRNGFLRHRRADEDDADDEFTETDSAEDLEELQEELLDTEDDFDDLEGDDPEEEPAPRRRELVGAGARRSAGLSGGRTDAHEADAYESESYETDSYETDSYGSDSGYSYENDERYRPIPHRRGRGGYDPEQAEITRAFRYRRRRRVTLTLLLLTLVSGAAAYFLVKPVWFATGFFGLLLVGYLTYLRRQVKVEADIRARRTARLRRARQIRPEYHPRDEYNPYNESLPDPSAPRPSTLPPVSYHRTRQIVDLDDDDPAFDDLEYYEPITYRRAVGE